MKSNIKGMVTKLKNKITNALHEVDISKLIEVAKLLNIRINPELEKYDKSENEQNRNKQE